MWLRLRRLIRNWTSWRRLRTLRHPALKEVRGRGLLVGLDIDPAWCDGRAFCERLLQGGVLTKETRESVVRLAPPLVIERETLDAAGSEIDRRAVRICL